MKKIKIVVLTLGAFAAVSRGFPLLEDYDYSEELDSDLDSDIFAEGDDFNLLGSSEKRINVRNVIKDPIYRWKDGIIYYMIDSVFNQTYENYIVQQLKEIENVTCLRFMPKAPNIVDYVHIMGRNNGCHSQVGRRGGRQVLNLKITPLSTGCFRKGVVIHEMLHTIGFYHEHNSPDRDDYLTISWENIQDDKISNFNKQSEEMVTNFSLPYDYESMSHYGRKIFSKNGLDTVVPKDPNANIGQWDRLSFLDIYKIKLMYNC